MGQIQTDEEEPPPKMCENAVQASPTLDETSMQAAPDVIGLETQTDLPSTAEAQTETPQSIENQAQTDKVARKDKGVHVHFSAVKTKDASTTMQTTRIRTGGGYHIVEGPGDGSANSLAKTWHDGVNPSP